MLWHVSLATVFFLFSVLKKKENTYLPLVLSKQMIRSYHSEEKN